jgi:nitrite reductase/ring-hydroxylating ferredoxin subunit
MDKKMTDKTGQPERGRRGFMKSLWRILGIVAVAEILWFIASLLKPSRETHKSRPAATLREIGSIDEFPAGSVTPDRVNRLYIVRENDGGFLALSLTCPHLGCSVLWNEDMQQFDCPCHSSAFDRRGIVLSSPAPRPLDYLPVIIDQGKVKVNMGSVTKRKKFEPTQLTYAL